MHRILVSAALAFSFVTGCVPYATPPVQLKAGGGWSSKPFKYETTSGTTTTTETTSHPGYLEAGFDSSSLSDVPITFGAGVSAAFDDVGLFGEVGTIWRILPKMRVGATLGYERWLTDEGNGARLGLLVEYASKDRHYAGTSSVDGGADTHNNSTTYSAQAGSWGIGGFVDVGHRWMPDDAENLTYLLIGLSVRFPALAGVQDASASH